MGGPEEKSKEGREEIHSNSSPQKTNVFVVCLPDYFGSSFTNAA